MGMYCRRKFLVEYFETDIDKPSTVAPEYSSQHTFDINCCDNCRNRVVPNQKELTFEESTLKAPVNELKDFSEEAYMLFRTVNLLKYRPVGSYLSYPSMCSNFFGLVKTKKLKTWVIYLLIKKTIQICILIKNTDTPKEPRPGVKILRFFSNLI